MLIWYSTFLLALEAGSVIQSRVARMAMGDLSESHLMVTEKVSAAFQACSILAGGGNASNVIACYREHVATNAARLNGADRGEPDQT